MNTVAFVPNKKTAQQRSDGGAEVSVNWEDDDSVEAFTLSDRAVAEFGAARLGRADIERLSGGAPVERPLTCERQETPVNTHHGNIVYGAHVPKPLQKMLAAALASQSRFVAPSRPAPLRS